MPSLRTTAGLAAGLAALGLAGYAAFVLVGSDTELAVVDALFEEPPGPESDQDARRRHEQLRALASNMGPSRSSIFDDEAAPTLSPGTSITPDEARAGFDHVMKSVEKLGRRRRRLDPDQWRETWRMANDAYAALSIQLDGEDPSDLAELEEAHRRLQKGLRRVRVRGGKFRYR